MRFANARVLSGLLALPFLAAICSSVVMPSSAACLRCELDDPHVASFVFSAPSGFTGQSLSVDDPADGKKTTKIQENGVDIITINIECTALTAGNCDVPACPNGADPCSPCEEDFACWSDFEISWTWHTNSQDFYLWSPWHNVDIWGCEDEHIENYIEYGEWYDSPPGSDSEEVLTTSCGYSSAFIVYLYKKVGAQRNTAADTLIGVASAAGKCKACCQPIVTPWEE